MEEGKFALANRFGCEMQRLADIGRFEVGIRFENLFFGHAVGNHANDSRHRYAQVPYARNAVHPLRIDRYPFEFHTHLQTRLTLTLSSKLDNSTTARLYPSFYFPRRPMLPKTPCGFERRRR